MKISQTKTDPGLEQSGVWRPIRYGVEVKVARVGNPRTTAWRASLPVEDQRLLDMFEKHTKQPVLYESKLDRIGELMIESYARNVLLDWRNIEDDEGEQIPYSPDNAKSLLRDYDWFFLDVRREAELRENFFRAEVAEVGKASPKRSSGKRSTATDSAAKSGTSSDAE